MSKSQHSAQNILITFWAGYLVLDRKVTDKNDAQSKSLLSLQSLTGRTKNLDNLEGKKSMQKPLLIAAFTLFSLGAITAEAKQCIYNSSGAVIDVQWLNHKGKKDNNSSGTIGVWSQSCQNNSNVGSAVITTSGCQFALLAAQTAVFGGGQVAFGACLVATGGGCSMAGGVFEGATAAAISAIPSNYGGKLIVAPNKGKSIKIGGNCFSGLKIQ